MIPTAPHKAISGRSKTRNLSPTPAQKNLVSTISYYSNSNRASKWQKQIWLSTVNTLTQLPRLIHSDSLDKF
nr:hypothetical protein CFP56_17212 [Quercus suber]